MRASTETSFTYPIQQGNPLAINSNGRFSVNSNLMNYSIPKHDATLTRKISSSSPLSQLQPTDNSSNSNSRREIKQGDSDTRTRQLEAQIEQLTLQNVKLQRTNRLLKVDTDNLIEQKTSPLEKTIQELTIANVKLQRASRLLQQELEEKTKQLSEFQHKQIMSMKSIGPEYEFLLQTINLLQRQISGHPACDETCCFTMQPIDQSTMVMTLPSPENEDDEEVEAQHICRPIIHSNVSQGSYALELEKKIHRLEQLVDDLDEEKEHIVHQQTYKDNDVETLKKELRIKDEIVSQLEQDFMGLEDQIEHLQKELQDQTMYLSSSKHNSINSMSRMLTPPPIQSDPKRQSQLLMQNKRRSLAIKDPDVLEQLLRGDLEGFSSSHYDDEELEIDESDASSTRAASPTMMVAEDSHHNKKGILSKSATNIKPENIPCTFLSSSSNHLPASHDNKKKNDPFAFFTGVTIVLGIASQLNVTDDWTVPITLATLLSSVLWDGNKKKFIK